MTRDAIDEMYQDLGVSVLIGCTWECDGVETPIVDCVLSSISDMTQGECELIIERTKKRFL